MDGVNNQGINGQAERATTTVRFWPLSVTITEFPAVFLSDVCNFTAEFVSNEKISFRFQALRHFLHRFKVFCLKYQKYFRIFLRIFPSFIVISIDNNLYSSISNLLAVKIQNSFFPCSCPVPQPFILVYFYSFTRAVSGRGILSFFTFVLATYFGLLFH